VSFERAELDRLTPVAPPTSGRPPSTAALAPRVLRLQRTAGNAAVGRLLARTPAHPMAKQIEVAEGLNERGLIDFTELSIMVDLTKADDKLRTTHLSYLRAIKAFEFSPRYQSRKQKQAPYVAATDLEKVGVRRSLEGTIASAGSVRLGIERAAKLKSPHAAEQLRLLRGDIKTVQEEFATRVKDNAYSFLDDSERRIAAVLGSYGLVIAHADVAVTKVSFDEDELDTEVDKWLERARLGQKDRYESKAAVENRASLGETVDRLRALQARVLKLQVGYMDLTWKVPLDARDRRMSDKRQKGASEVTKLIFGNTVTPAQRSKEEEIQKADRELSAAWIEAERRHPALAAHRGGQQRHLELIDLTSYGRSFAPTGRDFLDEINIRRAHTAARRTMPQGAHERGVVKEALRRLVNIHRTRLALRQGKLSFFKLEPVVGFTREQMLIHPKSVWRVAVDEVVSPHKGPLAQGLEFVNDVFNIALLALAAIPNPLQPLAALYDVARGAYTTVDEYVKQDLQSAYSDTDLDKARSISSADPSLTMFVISLLATGMGVAQAVAAFKAAAAARRAMLEGSDAARRTLNQLGKPHGLPNLGDDLASEAGIAGKGGKPPGSGAPEPPKPKPPPTEEPKPRPTAHPPESAPKPDDAPRKPPPHHPDLTADEIRLLARYTTHEDASRGIAEALRGLRGGTDRVGREMREFKTLLASMPPSPEKQQILEIIDRYYAAYRSRSRHVEYMAHLWERGAAQRISPMDALEREFADRGVTPHVVNADLTRDDVLRGPFIDMHFNNSAHGTHTHLYLEDFIDFHFGADKGRELHLLIAKAEGPSAEGGKPFWRKFFDAMVDEYDPLEINSPEGLQAVLRRLLGFPQKISPR
jgi:hypothetical protein